MSNGWKWASVLFGAALLIFLAIWAALIIAAGQFSRAFSHDADGGNGYRVVDARAGSVVVWNADTIADVRTVAFTGSNREKFEL